MNKVFLTIAMIFLAFIVCIIYAADTGQNTVFFDIVETIPYGDKLGHFFLFGILTLLLNLGLKLKAFYLYKRIPLGTVLVTVFVVLEELSQGFFINRTMDLADLMADGLGIMIFTLVSFAVSRNKLVSTDSLV